MTFSRLILCACLALTNILGINGQTFKPFPYKEETEANRSVSYHEAIEHYKKMSADPRLKMLEAGPSDVGYPIHEIIIDKDKEFTPLSAKKRAKTVIFINNGIHPGEPDGIDATLWLCQDILTGKVAPKLLDHAMIVIIPVYNIDGALVRNSVLRTNQNGPELYGHRGNGQNLDLNRDFIKCDSRNAMTFTKLFTKWDPDILIDNHVTNGADYTYVMTMLATQPDKLGYNQNEFLRNQMMPALNQSMTAMGFPMCPYVHVWGTTLDKGLPGFLDSPRYCSGYGALFQTFSFVPETHMLKPYGMRVQATYAFMKAMLEYNDQNYETLQTQRRQALQAVRNSETLPILWKEDRSRFDDFKFDGYAYDYVTSQVTGLPQLKYFRDQPKTWTLPFYNYYNVSKEIKVPSYYVIPQAWYRVIERLQANGVQMIPLDKDSTLTGEMYLITNSPSITSAYEGHFIRHSTQVETQVRSKTFLKGDFLIPTAQRARRFIVETLEPEATDSYFSWNFFDAILNRKEGFSDYAFDEMAADMLRENPELRTLLNEAIEKNPELKNNQFGQLNFIYEHSKHSEPFAKVYPIMRRF